MRRFELDGAPRRYWEVTLNGPRVEMRWGACNDGAPQTFGRAFPTEGEAEVFAERQVIAQRERGYIEIAQRRIVDVAPEVTALRHQRFEDSTSFVEVTQEGMKLTVRGGRMVSGKDVIEREKLHVQHFPHVAVASVAFDERCASIRLQGARAVEPEPAHAQHANAELEAQCDASPDSPEPWAVYADWLIAHGDARGEIAALQQAGKAAEAKRVLGTHLRDLCGTDSGKLAFDYRHGFAVGCTIDVEPDSTDLLEDVTRMLLASPMGRFLESLRFGLAGQAGENDWSPTIHAVADSPRGPHVRALAFDHYDAAESELSWTPYGDFSGAWAKLPALERLVIRSGAGGTLGAIDLPNLRAFTRISGGLAHAEIDDIAGARWPKLERLELWFGSHHYGAEADVTSLRPFLGEGWPALQHLGLCNCELADEIVPLLARAKILPQLRSLDLSNGTMGRDGAAALIAHADAFRHLARIELGGNYLTEAEVAQLREVLPSIAARDQRDREEDIDRYAAVGE